MEAAWRPFIHTLSCSFMGRGVIDLPLNEIAAEICHVELSHVHHWNKFLVVSALVCTWWCGAFD